MAIRSAIVPYIVFALVLGGAAYAVQERELPREISAWLHTYVSHHKDFDG
ncbi:MAG: hypothetical protein HYV92_01600 [Candidatus Rokubacteria bacterium]|nr:hypothetical protein [Candidatus Rokubacteria bacterium]MBI2553131.1 hypothetical protein [Candidatus Rokubacteria bacterium]